MRRVIAAIGIAMAIACFLPLSAVTADAAPKRQSSWLQDLFKPAPDWTKARKVRKATTRVRRAAPARSLPVANRSLVGTAQAYMGRTAAQLGLRRTLWCAAFMNKVLRKLGHRGTGSDMARSFARYGRRVSGPMVGAIAVMSRGRRGGHVGVVAGLCHRGVEVISGNHGRRVGRGCYPRSRIYAYVLPPARMASR